MTNQNEQLQWDSAVANYELLYDGGESVEKTPSTPVISSVGGESSFPCLLKFSEDSEDVLMQQICSERVYEGFRLAPVYTMYMMLRFRLSQKYKPESLLWEKLHSIGVIILKMVNYIWAAVDQAHADKRLLAYWLSNSSELIYYFNHDVHLSQQGIDAQEALAECVQVAFKYFVSLMKKHIGRYCLSPFWTFRFCRSYRIWLVFIVFDYV